MLDAVYTSRNTCSTRDFPAGFQEQVYDPSMGALGTAVRRRADGHAKLSAHRTVAGLFAALLLIAWPLHAQWPDHGWWTQGPFLETHPVAHVIDGGAADLIVRGPWIAKPWRDAVWKRMAWTGIVGTGFELVQIQEFHGAYPVKYALGDLLATIAGAALTEGVVSLLKQHHPSPATASNP